MQLTEPGHILALAHGRKYDCGDTDWIDVVSRRSYDNGKTWDDMTLVYSGSDAQNNVTIGTVSACGPCPPSLPTSPLFDPLTAATIARTHPHVWRLGPPPRQTSPPPPPPPHPFLPRAAERRRRPRDRHGLPLHVPRVRRRAPHELRRRGPELERAVVDPTWQSVYTGLPQGLQLANGRLIICANHMHEELSTKSHTIFSDDHGKTWTSGKSVGPR